MKTIEFYEIEEFRKNAADDEFEVWNSYQMLNARLRRSESPQDDYFYESDSENLIFD